MCWLELFWRQNSELFLGTARIAKSAELWTKNFFNPFACTKSAEMSGFSPGFDLSQHILISWTCRFWVLQRFLLSYSTSYRFVLSYVRSWIIFAEFSLGIELTTFQHRPVLITTMPCGLSWTLSFIYTFAFANCFYLFCAELLLILNDFCWVKLFYLFCAELLLVLNDFCWVKLFLFVLCWVIVGPQWFLLS